MSRWKKWLLRTLPVALLVPVAGVLIDRQLVRWAGQKQLAKVVAELDATDPGWRLDDILAAREKDIPPDDQNLFVLSERIHYELPPAYQEWQKQSEWRSTDDLNRLPRPADLAAARQAWTENRAVIELARKARSLPRGGARWVVPANPFSTLLEHDQRLRNIGALMSLDATVAAAFKRPDDAVAASRTTLSAGRAIGDEPCLISMLVRMAIGAIAVNDLERTLGWTEAQAGLPELQSELLAEAEATLLAVGVRGERAMLDRMFHNLDSGTLTVSALGNSSGSTGLTFGEWWYRRHLPGDWAAMLALMSEVVEVASGPTHEWDAKLAAIVFPAREPKTLLTSLLIPNYIKMAEADRRTKARLRTAAIAIACERHRRATGKWPTTLAELPKDLLPAVPLDPYDGEPLRLAKTDDGIVIYSVGPDRIDDDGTLSRTYRPDEIGVDYGFRLWDVAKRRLDPLPEPKDEPPVDP
jgi:hypothetical protein